MASVFGWVDFLDSDREKMVSLINQLREQDTRDELGLGSVRDAFANMMFPGTSTIQTRAKYMLFIPWIYLHLEKQKTPANIITKKARNLEIQLIHKLLASHDTDGIIGRDARENLQRLPSNIYWTGLGRWGIRRYIGSQEQYHRELDSFYRRSESVLKGDDKEPVNQGIITNWDNGLPKAPENLLTTPTLTLNQDEAEYLYHRIMLSCKNTLLAELIDLGGNPVTCNFVWEHPDLYKVSSSLKDQVNHGRNFSEIMHGAALLYNLMLAQLASKNNPNGEGIEKYQNAINDWKEIINRRRLEFLSWDLKIFWSIVDEYKEANVTIKTRDFINKWIELVLHSGQLEHIEKNESARKIIYNREIDLKRNRSRLHYPRYLELWTGAAGTGQLNFRWRTINVIINDILKGLHT